MKKVHIIFKTHLDLGFTDFASNIIDLYNTKFIPDALRLAKEVNTQSHKKFIWTTGSWIIHNALNTLKGEEKQDLLTALSKGDIAIHGLPFTTHTELLDTDTFRYGLDIAKTLESITNRTLIAAKMTDVPGHTKAMLPLLEEYGIKFLHIGVNEGSAVPEVPRLFRWRHMGSEILVMYQKSYGEVYKNPHIEDILYFAHSADNMGPISKPQLEILYEQLKKDYPDYEISASTLDDYASKLLDIKDKLPIIDAEIGDSWIHGAATDPYKIGAMRELLLLKDKWLAEKSITKGSKEYNHFIENLLLVSEHTCGLDTKKFLSDIGLYTKKDFQKKQISDKPKLKLLQRGMGEKLIVLCNRHKGIYKKGSYSAMEKSWQEQRNYLDWAISSLGNSHKTEATLAIDKLLPTTGFDDQHITDDLSINTTITVDDYQFAFNEYGALKHLSYKNHAIILDNLDSLVDYHSYSSKDYDYWRDNYSRNYNEYWVRADFGRPLLKYLDNKYPHGRFFYYAKKVTYKELQDKIQVLVQLEIDPKLHEQLGTPKVVEMLYTFSKDKFCVDFELIWLQKTPSRLTESLSVNFPFVAKNLQFKKLDSYIYPFDIVKNGNRNLSAVQEVTFDINDTGYILKNIHSPLISIGKVDILKFDNKYKQPEEGLSFNLHNNIWGTNFPLWYGENAYFKFILLAK